MEENLGFYHLPVPAADSVPSERHLHARSLLCGPVCVTSGPSQRHSVHFVASPRLSCSPHPGALLPGRQEPGGSLLREKLSVMFPPPLLLINPCSSQPVLLKEKTAFNVSLAGPSMHPDWGPTAQTPQSLISIRPFDDFGIARSTC